MSESAEYQIVTDGDRSLPTIVNSEGRSILAIDWRVVDHRGIRTPVFADPAIAERVLAALNAQEAGHE